MMDTPPPPSPRGGGDQWRDVCTRMPDCWGFSTTLDWCLARGNGEAWVRGRLGAHWCQFSAMHTVQTDVFNAPSRHYIWRHVQ